MIELSVTEYPKKELVATCSECKTEIGRYAWDTYAQYTRVKAAAKKKCKCPKCKDVATKDKLVWKRHVDIYGQITKSWEADAGAGDFLVWKVGKLWKARYRVYGSDNPIMLGFASTLELIKQRCERSEYWQGGKK